MSPTSSTPPTPPCIHGDECSLTKTFLVTEIYHAYGPSLLAATVGFATVIWQTGKGNNDVKKELQTEMHNVQAIALGSAYATLKSFSEEKEMIARWIR